MLIGLRLVLLVGGLLAATALLGFLFTRKPKLLYYAKAISLTTLILVALFGLMFLIPRLLAR